MKVVNGNFYLLLLGFCFLFLQSCNNSDNEDNGEKNLEEIINENLGQTSAFEDLSDTLQIAHLVRVWNGCHNIKFLDNLNNLYASSLFFYGEDRSKYEAIQVKKNLFRSYPEYFQRVIGGMKIKKINPIEYRCDFTKYISVGKITAPVPSYIIFKKIEDNQWLIIAESDPATDTKVKAIKDSMQVLEKIYSISNVEIQGNFSGKGLETIYIFPPENQQCTDCITSLIFSNELLPAIDIKGAKSASLLNEGDLDGDGADEFSVLVNVEQGVGRMTIYTFKRGEWKILKRFNVNYEQISTDDQSRRDAIQLAGSGYINIQKSEGDSIEVEKVNVWNF
ncbi:MAG: hypothetical protein LC105_03460 [Chitinophagales bacterium]|nr:hypothetical protein [Chitinophagales bacterium]MCZ2392899.1 hypothetical protein [Chitinophagales bacterium]